MASLDAIFEARVNPMDQYLARAPLTDGLKRHLSPCAAGLLFRIESPTKVRDIVGESGIPRRDCIRLVAGLLRRGVLVPSRPLHH
jgi:hypothetical protein